MIVIAKTVVRPGPYHNMNMCVQVAFMHGVSTVNWRRKSRANELFVALLPPAESLLSRTGLSLRARPSTSASTTDDRKTRKPMKRNAARKTVSCSLDKRSRHDDAEPCESAPARVPDHAGDEDEDMNSELFSNPDDFITMASGNTRPWTDDPYHQLRANADELVSLLHHAKALVAVLLDGGAPDGGALMRQLCMDVVRITGHDDFALSQDVPPAGTKVVLVRALCERHELSLADGDATLSGAFLSSFARATGLRLVYSNIATTCWRKGKDGCALPPTAAARRRSPRRSPRRFLP